MLHHTPPLTLIPHGGLGNRLWAIIAALRLVIDGRFDHIHILWLPGPHLEAIPNDLFVIDGPVTIEIINDLDERYHEIPLHQLTMIDDKVVLRAAGLLGMPWKLAISIATRIKFLDSFYRVADKFDVKNRIGLHCRRTDWGGRDVRTEELAVLQRRLDIEFVAYIEKLSKQPLFLATDSPYTMAYFSEHFTGRLLYYPKEYYPNWSYRCAPCVYEAVVDMILLGRCRRIIADSDSSFAQSAALFGGNAIQIWQRPVLVKGA